MSRWTRWQRVLAVACTIAVLCGVMAMTAEAKSRKKKDDTTAGQTATPAAKGAKKGAKTETATAPTTEKSSRRAKQAAAAPAASAMSAPATSPAPAATGRGADGRFTKKTPASATPSSAPAAAATPATTGRGADGRFVKRTPASPATASAQPAAAPAPAYAPASHPAPTMAAPNAGNGMVWVNLDSKVYHAQGSRWYGKTKHGQYMTETEATRQGYRPAKAGGQ